MRSRFLFVLCSYDNVSIYESLTVPKLQGQVLLDIFLRRPLTEAYGKLLIISLGCD